MREQRYGNIQQTSMAAPEVEATYPLDHPRRQLMYALVRELPGLNPGQVREKAEISPGVLQFHLRILEDTGFLIRKPGANIDEVLLFVAKDAALAEDPRTHMLYGSGATRRVALHVAARPGTTVEGVATALRLRAMTIRYHLDKLMNGHLIRREPDRNRYLYWPEAELSEWVENVGRGYLEEEVAPYWRNVRAETD